ncbi:MAG: T9SS type A sorting domain-containing protein [Candidatus Marinimicrobia bacterium]|nr:T9SS type A sorting domain-containing protein [Candidatus Neomarinimicrobiota bacterium]MCF7850309.1 T9SS type A sorting domain-containing protein [Candidatus Neomarinimicrobiota bacterium]MCF7903901.1 T9SS type A sorting domain-containing protein [Candidatus Neomarinimicrobiota bacterium]
MAISDVPLLKMRFNRMDTTCVVPLDTLDRFVYIENGAIYPDPPYFELDSLIILCTNTTNRTLEYRFSTFVGIDFEYDERQYDTLNSYSVTLDARDDSIFYYQETRDSVFVSGFGVIDTPDSLETKIIIEFDHENLSRDRFRLTYSADTLGDWLAFYPLALGNTWKYSGPWPDKSESKLKVVSVSEDSLATNYWLARQQLDGYERKYLTYDTLHLKTSIDNPYSIIALPYGFPWHWGDFYPYEENHTSRFYNSIIITPTGNTNFREVTMGGGFHWTYGIGLVDGDFEGGGDISLLGYSIDGANWGDISDPVYIQEIPALPRNLSLGIYPNPFNPNTTITYDLPEDSHVNLTIYDVTGREVVKLLDEEQPSGHYEVGWNGTDALGNPVSTGLYFARLQAGAPQPDGVQFSATIKMVFLK